MHVLVEATTKYICIIYKYVGTTFFRIAYCPVSQNIVRAIIDLSCTIRLCTIPAHIMIRLWDSVLHV
jgi:hypothetical protein